MKVKINLYISQKIISNSQNSIKALIKKAKIVNKILTENNLTMMITDREMSVVKEKITDKKMSVITKDKETIKEKDQMIMKEIAKENTDDYKQQTGFKDEDVLKEFHSSM